MIRLERLNKSYDDNIIYKDSSYTFKENALTCFYGESGSGKTTLFNILAGFDNDFEGEIFVNGLKLNQIKNDDISLYRYENIGFVFQNYYLLKGYTALENVLMALNLDEDLSEDDKKKKALEALERLNLKEEANQRIETLSGGQKQRVSIARALINNPSIILADEPTGALDIDNTIIIMDILKEISKDKTVIVITHDEEVLKYGDEVITLEKGKIKKIKESVGEEGVKEEKKKEIRALNLKRKYINSLAVKNFKINIFKNILAMIMLAVALSVFTASFGLNDITKTVMEEYKEKNNSYKVGQVEEFDSVGIDEVYNELGKMDTIEEVYYQSSLKNITLKSKDSVFEMKHNSPAIISGESLAYGSMPINDGNEIALSSGLAGMLSINIKDLIDTELNLQYNDKENNTKNITLKVVGITNNAKQNFILSSKVEKEIYENIDDSKADFNTVRFEVKDFDKIPEIYEELKVKGINASIRVDEISVFKDTFNRMISLFKILSYVIFVVGTFISLIVLYKVLIERRYEVAIIGAIGYKDRDISKILITESILASLGTIILTFALMPILNMIVKNYLGYALDIDMMKIITIVVTVVIVNIGGTLALCKSILKKDKSVLLR